MFLRSPCLLAAIAFLSASLFGHAKTAESAPNPNDPVGLAYFQPDDFRQPKISPGGKSVGFIARTGQTTKLFRLDLASGQIAGVFDPGDGDIENFWWCDDSRVFLQAGGKDGTVYFSLNLADGQSRKLKNLSRTPIYRFAFRRGLPGQMLVARFEPRTVLGFTWTVVDMDTGKEKTPVKTKGHFDYAVPSATGEILSETWSDIPHWYVQWRTSARAPWQRYDGTNPIPDFYTVDLHVDERQLLVFAYDQGDTSALMLLDPATGKRTLLARRPDRDISRLLTLSSTGRPYGVQFYNVAESDHAIFVPEYAAFLRRLDGVLQGRNTRLIDSSDDGSVRIVANWNSGQPWTYYLYAGGRLALLNRQRETPSPEKMGRTQLFTFTTRDGLQANGSVILPLDGKGPHPLVVRAPAFVAEAADDPSLYDAESQYLVSRGYAVATLALRGQWGYGRSFAAAGKLALKDRLVNDLEDAVRYLVDQGLADQKRIVLDGSGARALFALYTARGDSPFRALVIREPRDTPQAADLDWQFDGTRELYAIYQEVGGVHNAYQLMQTFDPASTIPEIRVPVLLIGRKVTEVTSVENLLRTNKRTFVRQVTEWSSRQQKWPQQTYEVARGVADFLDANLPAPAP